MNSSTVERWLVKPGVESSLPAAGRESFFIRFVKRNKRKMKWNRKSNGENYPANGSKVRLWMIYA